ncbi:methyltransferase domain-containing protein [Fulvivirga sediminis]|uniref:Methyltransferase domain-containing protein n=1 Tax=Fulvivirga sediminis TaxID=2803949 RepID=A0A937F2U1_9BACT|nr:methyltransferase domain-containing protein [Fulvivirga sediminis]MBL3654695.1 methyltransferase domain-containing protein [Fulvivirga sediminis]
MPSKFENRSNEPELMDDLNSSGQVIDQTLKELEVINKWLGGNYVTTNGISKLASNRKQTDSPLIIVDLGCGSGDMLKRIARWGRKTKLKLQLIGIDANPNIIEWAKNNSKDYDEISYKCLNIFSDEFKNIKCDFITATLFTHHFTDKELIQLLKQFRHQAKLGVVINDLHRHWFAFHSIKILTSVFSKSAMVKYDAALSVLRSFRKKDLQKILNESGCTQYSLKWLWAFRWQLIIRF